MAEHGEMIRRVAADYGVQPRFIASIIGLESDYGTYPIDEPLFDVVATLAFDGRRGAQFRREFMAALEIVDKGYAKPEQMKSSWAGALGVPQFTPSNVLAHGVDHDGDGHIDLWSVGPDVVASIANYLRKTGWRGDQTWGREVTLPSGGEETLAAPQNAGLDARVGLPQLRELGRLAPARRLARARRAPHRGRGPARAQPARGPRRRRHGRRPRLARLP